jgi:3-phenylpropionate/cinnamic acid dioxygenase small subunit
MNAALPMSQVEEFLYREAWLLDQQRWDEWLDLFLPECRFWVPAWKQDHELVDDPDTGLSFVYYDSRGGLEDRVWRAKSGLSVASTPLPRTCHQVTNVRCEAAGPDRALVRSSWNCHVFDLRTHSQHVFFGYYEHLLAGDGGTLRIASKKIVLQNDLIHGFIDFYCV